MALHVFSIWYLKGSTYKGKINIVFLINMERDLNQHELWLDQVTERALVKS